MSKIKSRFIALLVLFTSVVSFFSVGFGGQVANAATIPSDATAIQVYVTGSTTPLTPKNDGTDNEDIYSTPSYSADGFDVVVKNLTVTDLLDQANSKKSSGSGTVSGIIGQSVEIVSINGTSCNTAEGQSILSELGIAITDSADPNTSRDTIGKKITGLPLGVNKIKYKLTVITQDIDYTAAVTSTDSNGNTTTTSASVTPHDPVEKDYAAQDITIYHGTKYAVNKISSMLFKAYVGSATNFDEDTDEVLDDDLRENNKVPFLYSTTAEPDSEMPLRYTFDVPDSTTTLKYVMTFGSTIPLEGATVYKNGARAKEGTEYTISGKSLTGSLESLNNDSDLIVVKLNSTSSDSSIVEKSYAIEIKYNQLSSNEDFSLINAGITKLNYNDDNSVKAYVGKKFTVATDVNDILTYTGDIYIDKKATMISLSPTLIRNQNTDNVAYVLTNNYYDEATKSTKVKKSVLKNGMQFIDFMTSSTTNKLQLDVYEGANGNITDNSKPLARYIFNVTLSSSDTFSLDLAFKNASSSSEEAYLTQPGVKANTIDFSTSRRTYDLYCADPVKVIFALKSENDEYTGIRSGKNEYLRVWLADSVNSNNLKEAQASIDNVLDSNNTRKTSIDVDLNGAKKMVVQAYYDDVTETTTGASATVSHAVGDQYVFYLPNNYDDSDNTGDGDEANDALLNYLKVKGATLEDSDGNEGFSSNVYDYTTTVDKDDTTAKITATAEDDNVKSIVATVEDTKASYDLVSGEESDITLDADGKTTIDIVVTAQDGTTTKKYTVVIKNNTKSSNVNLKNIILNTGDYDFDSSEDTTKVHVSQSTTGIKVTPVPEDSSSTVTVSGKKYTGSAITVSLKGSQKTEIEIVVKSEDGKESKTYTLEIYRTDSDNWDNDNDDSNDSSDDDQYYDKYYNCWVDTTKYEEWGKIGNKPAYFDKNNRQVKDAWISTGGKYYYLNSSGYRASGWKVDDKTGQTYYLDPTTGEMRKGWMNLNNSWYYLGLNGVMKKGWLNLNGKWYYFTPNGQMVVNQSMYIDDGVYNFGQDGVMY